ncbi:protein mab-21-like 3 [Mytilus trossulus]|uniref:protein mab-21-like 3 n=1 Tax=Mytilus trossulus TaxID=6551 RepID=UPI0030065606
MDNTMLDTFYKNNIKLTKDETKDILDFVKPKIDYIVQYIHERDKRFKLRPLNVGSYYSRLKVSRADEFDYSVVLDSGPYLVWTTQTPAFSACDTILGNTEVVRTSSSLPSAPVGKCVTKLSRSIPQWNKKRMNEGSDCLTIGDHIIPMKVKKRFQALVIEAIKQPLISRYVDAKRSSGSPAVTLTIADPDADDVEPISVDLAPLIEAHLPFKPEFNWPRPQARWPSSTQIKDIQDEGIHLVAKDPEYWTLSFVTCEKKLLESTETTGTCRNKSHRIMKKLCEIWCPEGTKQVLNSYHIKNIYFWECEYHPDDWEWTKKQLAVRVESMCDLLIKYIDDRNLPVYFHTGINLFKNYLTDQQVFDNVQKEIRTFWENPEDYLRDYMEEEEEEEEDDDDFY